MATIPYFEFEEKIKDILSNSPTLAGTRIEIETALVPSIEIQKIIRIYLKNSNYKIAQLGYGNNSRDVNINILIECIGIHLNSIKEACKRRDNLIALTEDLIKQQATLRSLQSVQGDTQIIGIILNNVTFETAEDNSATGFLRKGTIELLIQLRG